MVCNHRDHRDISAEPRAEVLWASGCGWTCKSVLPTQTPACADVRGDRGLGGEAGVCAENKMHMWSEHVSRRKPVVT